MALPVQSRLLIYFNWIASFFRCLRTKNHNQYHNHFDNQHQTTTSPRLSFLGRCCMLAGTRQGLDR